MKAAFYGKSIGNDSIFYFQQFLTKLENSGFETLIYEPFYKTIVQKIKFSKSFGLYNYAEEIKGCNFLFSIGGDGTLLDSVTMVRNSNIPIIGINMGRLGFLSSIPKEEIDEAINNILKGNYYIEERTLLNLSTQNNYFGELNFALNDVVIYKKDPFSLIKIKTYLNDVYLNTYWADGLIIATPTGSSAYSLSCGGPIITPQSENFILTPIASHNMTVRPIVIPDTDVIKIAVEGRDKDFYVSLDSRNENIMESVELTIKKAPFKVSLIRMVDKDFFSTLRDKLKWGFDNRN
ncbi:MAG: NAD kinase [Bacteroidota bacterium]